MKEKAKAKRSESSLKSMRLSIRFSQPINPEGFFGVDEFWVQAPDELAFEFEYSIGNIDLEDPNVVNFELMNIVSDEEINPCEIKAFTEINLIYDEGQDPVEILELVFITEDGEEILASEKLIDSMNEAAGCTKRVDQLGKINRSSENFFKPVSLERWDTAAF